MVRRIVDFDQPVEVSSDDLVLIWKVNEDRTMAAPASLFAGGGINELSELIDVNIDQGTLNDGQSLVYSESEQKWINASVGSRNDTWSVI